MLKMSAQLEITSTELKAYEEDTILNMLSFSLWALVDSDGRAHGLV